MRPTKSRGEAQQATQVKTTTNDEPSQVKSSVAPVSDAAQCGAEPVVFPDHYCAVCVHEFKSKSGLSTHLRWVKSIL